MPKKEDKVGWCLRKARDELAQNRKHRGLVRTEPNISEAQKHIEKAEHNFKAVIAMEKAGLSDWSVSAAFYTIYRCFLAVITKHGYESRNQECTIALMRHLREKGKTDFDEKVIDAFDLQEHESMKENSIIQMRENFQYGTETSIDDKRLEGLKDICKQAIDQAKIEIFNLD